MTRIRYLFPNWQEKKIKTNYSLTVPLLKEIIMYLQKHNGKVVVFPTAEKVNPSSNAKKKSI